MLKSLSAVIGLSLLGCFTLFYFSSDRPTTYNSLVRSQIVYFPKEKVLIYGATNYFGSPMSFSLQSCSEEIISYCSYTTDLSRSLEADAWLYHNRDYSPRLMEKWTNAPVHVMFTQESPVHETIRFKPDTINWTMTYRRDSDVFWPYGSMEMKVFSTKMNNDTIWDMKEGNLTAAWVVSNCKTRNKRMQIAKKAKAEGLEIDIYGGCDKLKLPSCGRYAENRNQCAAKVLKKYYFYFSFENSNCVDYVTEKFYNALRLFYSVPIVIKRDIYTKMGFPPKSFIALDDFKSIKDLVNFLQELKQDKKKYLSYHEWRNDWEVSEGGDNMGLCALCRQLKAPILSEKSYSNLEKWFKNEACDDSYSFKYL